jgi:Flp pilus assembly pilin Flp
MKSWMKRLCREESGQDLTEYALLLVLIALAAVTALKGLAGAINNVYNATVSNLVP